MIRGLLDDVGLHNFHWIKTKTGILFRPGVRDLFGGPVPEEFRASNLAGLADTLRNWFA